MSLYTEHCECLITEDVDDEFFLGVVLRKEPDSGKLLVRKTTNVDDRHSQEWSESGITWRFVPELKLITFWEQPTAQELTTVKEWLKKNQFDLRGIRVRIYGSMVKTIKIDPNTTEPDFVRRRKSGIDESNTSYCGVLLDNVSQKKLKTLFSNLIPDGWTIKCHHMTIDPFNECKEGIGTSVNLMLTHFGKADKVCAVKVIGYKGKTNNAFPHVTIAVNEIDGGEAKDSNKITEWTPISKHITLTGTIENL